MFTALVVLLVFGSVFFFALVVMSVLMKAYAEYQERYVAKSVNDLSDMFLFIDPRQLLVLNIASMCLSGMLAYLLVNPLVAIIATVGGFFFPMLMVRYYRSRRVKMFNKQLIDALQQVSNALKAGRTFMQGVEDLSHESSRPLKDEFSLFVKEAKLGVSPEEAYNNMAARVGSEDLDLVVTSTNIARSLGGNMAEMYETLSATIRERMRLEGKIQSMVAQGRLQGWVVSAMPLVMGIAINIMRPDLMEPMMDHWFGWILVLVVIIMEVLGFIMIQKITNIDV